MTSYLDTANGLNKVTNLGVKQVTELFKLIRGVLVHDVACQALDNVQGKITESSLYLPQIGVISIKYNSKGDYEYSFKPEKTFNEAITKARTTGESELLKNAEQAMVEKIKERYQSLI